MLALQLCGDTGGHLLPPSMIQTAFPVHWSIEAPACSSLLARAHCQAGGEGAIFPARITAG
jgi:hypothetical protein